MAAMQGLRSQEITPQPFIPLLALSDKEQKPSQSNRIGRRNSWAKRKPGNRVLMVGRVRELALYRAEVLRQAGFTVLIAGDDDEAVPIIRGKSFDAIVLSYTLPNHMVQYLADTARDHCPDCPVIAIAETRMLDRRIEPDAVAIADDGPAALLTALNRVLEPK